MARDYFAPALPRLFGHRGAAGVAPENTMPSFERAVAAGVGYLELDVHATRDGTVVALHDATLDRTTDATGRVRNRTLEELRSIDAGCRFEQAGSFPFRGREVRIPTLVQILEAFPDVSLNVEIKQVEPAIEAIVVDDLRRCGAVGRVLLAAEDHDVMRRIRACGNDVRTSLSFVETREFFERMFAKSLDGYEPPGTALQIPPRFSEIELVTAQTVSRAHDLGLEVHVWTINEAAEMERLLALGVDGLMSDFPSLLVEVAARR